MTDKAKELVSLYVQSIVRDSDSQFEDAIMNNVKMVHNAVTLSVDLSTQIILDLLDYADVLPITSEEKVLQKLALRIHTDSKK